MKKKSLSLKFLTILVLFLFILSACIATDQRSAEEIPAITFIEPATISEEEQSFNFLRQSVKFESLDVFAGLSSNVVNKVIQDQYGLIWIATIDGLNKYDGKKFTVYKWNVSEANSLINNAIWDIFEDSNGNLWVGTDGGLDKFNRADDSFTHYQHHEADSNSLPNNFVRAIYEDSRGNLWIGTSGGGLSKFDLEIGEFTTYIHEDSNPYSLANNIVRAIYEDSRGYLWIGTWNGLDRFDYETGRFFHFNQETDDDSIPDLNSFGRGMRGSDTSADVFITTETQFAPSTQLPGNHIMDIEEDIDGSLWLATYGGGLKKFDPYNGSFDTFLNVYTQETSLSSNNVNDIYRDSQDNFWFGTNDGLNLYDRRNDRFVHFISDPTNQEDSNNLSNDIINSIFEDSAGMYWIGTSGGGLNVFSPTMNRFQHVKNDPMRPSSLSSNIVWAFQQDYDGTLWVANDAGVDMMRKDAGYFIHYDPHPEDLRSENDAVYTIMRDSTGMLWIGTARGLSRFNYIENRFVTVSSYFFQNKSDIKDLDDVTITDLQEDRAGNIWIGTYGNGILKLSPSTGSITTLKYEPDAENGISSNIVNTIIKDSSGQLWVGTIGGGLNLLNPANNHFENFQNDPESINSISDNNITSLAIDEDGMLWIGTYNGLNRYDPSTASFKAYTIRDGLISDTILGIVVDNAGFIWISNGNGLSQFDPDNESFVNFTYRDGLQGSEFISGSCGQGGDGVIYFGGMDGYNYFYPNQLIGNSYIPQIVLVSLTQSGEDIARDYGLEELDEITLKWPENYFEFEFSALSFIQPEKNEYAYILEGFDKEWNYVGTRSYGRYTNLTQGNYKLRLIASNNDGIWNTTGKVINIRVIPAWWQSQWFRISAVLLVTLAVIAIFRLQIGSVERYNRKLTQEVQDRTSDIERRRRVADGLREILIRLNSNLPVRESIDFIACQIGTLVSARSVVIVEIKGERRTRPQITYRKENCNEEENISANLMTGIPDDVIEQVTRQIKTHEDFTITKTHDDSSVSFTYTGVPIYLGGDVYGGLIIQHGDFEIRHEELELLKSFADQVGLALGNELLRTKAEEMAVVTERNRIARDLHDAITQTLFSANLIAETIAEVWNQDRDKAMQLIKEMRQLNQSALAEMRTLLLELRPSSVLETDMAELLDQLANVLRGRAGCQVELFVEGVCDVPDTIHVGIYRIAQEAITNIMKHANATHVRIQLNCNPMQDEKGYCNGKRIELKIEDNGKGFNPALLTGGRFGLSNMRQRATLIGADLIIHTDEGSGTSIQVIWQESEDATGNGKQDQSSTGG
jgi:ligand-binding sensor domain-containing protein/signal transduction histidine kinase